jgi:uncharacterized Zn-binding protein involved in type VI secretion
MAEKGVARLSDTGSHGGKIINGSNSIFVNGRPMARVGDLYACPIHGNNPIISGVTTIFGEGMLVAHVGSMTACGAVITSGSPDTVVDDSTSIPDTHYAAAAINLITEADDTSAYMAVASNIDADADGTSASKFVQPLHKNGINDVISITERVLEQHTIIIIIHHAGG